MNSLHLKFIFIYKGQSLSIKRTQTFYNIGYIRVV